MKALFFAVLAVLVMAGTGFPPAAGAQTCCQYAGSCEDMPGSSGLTAADCVEDAGQPATGACLADHGVCEGTVVCCDTTCRGDQACSMTTAGDCVGLDAEAIPHAGATCSGDGTCAAECTAGCTDAGQVYCNGDCVSLASDHENCGECGNDCRSNETCSDGVCKPAGTANETTTPLAGAVDGAMCSATPTTTQPGMCGGQCVDLSDDPKNCGACGTTCGTGQYCSGGQCASKKPNGSPCTSSSECTVGCCSATTFDLGPAVTKCGYGPIPSFAQCR